MAINVGIIDGIIEELSQETYGKTKVTRILLKHNLKRNSKDGYYFEEKFIPFAAFGYVGNSINKNCIEGMHVTLQYELTSNEYKDKFYPNLIVTEYVINKVGLNGKVEGTDVPFELREQTETDDDVPF